MQLVAECEVYMKPKVGIFKCPTCQMGEGFSDSTADILRKKTLITYHKIVSASTNYENTGIWP
jgi:hypothetical protein